MNQFEEQQEKDSRRHYAQSLMRDWSSWNLISPLNTRAYNIIKAATRKDPANNLLCGITAHDIHLHLIYCTYLVITHQPLTCRNVELPRHENQTTTWRIAQFILFITLFFGIAPMDGEYDMLLSRGWIFYLFIAFVAISAWCRYSDKCYEEHKRRTATLNAAVTESEIAAYLRTSECAEKMREYLAQPNCKYTAEIKEYLSWYKHEGGKNLEII